MEDLLSYLQTLDQVEDRDIDLAQVALVLAALRQPDVSLDRFENHLKKLVEHLVQAHARLLVDGVEDSADLRLQALRTVFVDQEGYDGDRDHYDSLENASLMRVIDRRKGVPITLSVLCLHMIRGAGWEGHGLNVPGHFICRLDVGGDRVMFDPFDECRALKAHDLRALVKRTQGADAELSAQFYEPAPNRDILIRLQNNIKFRQIESEDYAGALETLEAMRLVDPDEHRLLLEIGVLRARVGQAMAAIRVLEDYVAVTPDQYNREEARRLLADLKLSLN